MGSALLTGSALAAFLAGMVAFFAPCLRVRDAADVSGERHRREPLAHGRADRRVRPRRRDRSCGR